MSKCYPTRFGRIMCEHPHCTSFQCSESQHAGLRHAASGLGGAGMLAPIARRIANLLVVVAHLIRGNAYKQPGGRRER
jgi:hypothetical protein